MRPIIRTGTSIKPPSLDYTLGQRLGDPIRNINKFIGVQLIKFRERLRLKVRYAKPPRHSRLDATTER